MAIRLVPGVAGCTGVAWGVGGTDTACPACRPGAVSSVDCAGCACAADRPPEQKSMNRAMCRPAHSAECLIGRISIARMSDAETKARSIGPKPIRMAAPSPPIAAAQPRGGTLIGSPDLLFLSSPAWRVSWRWRPSHQTLTPHIPAMIAAAIVALATTPASQSRFIERGPAPCAMSTTRNPETRWLRTRNTPSA